jgi:rSAM/selenodomain-associated transferase 1
MSDTAALFVVAKKPDPGQTKTRLSPPLTAAQAAGLYDCFLHDTLDLMRKVSGVKRGIAFLPESEGKYFHTLAPDMKLVSQRGSSLGERLDHLAKDVLAAGFMQVVIIDSDSPTLPVEYLYQAFERLASADVVFGPTQDGGYYLIGMKAPQSRLLRGVQMSTPHVLSDTLKLADSAGIVPYLLPAWYDVDTITDLHRLNSELSQPGVNGKASATHAWLRSTAWRRR